MVVDFHVKVQRYELLDAHVERYLTSLIQQLEVHSKAAAEAYRMAETANWAYWVYPLASIAFFVAVETWPDGRLHFTKIGLFLTAIVLLPTAIFLACWPAFGLDRTLSWASDFIPIAFAAAGCAFSIRKVRHEHHFGLIAVLIIVGILGTVILHISRVREANRLYIAETNNSTLLTKLINPSLPSNPQVAEIERRQDIKKSLATEYILSHQDISADVLAGTEPPPIEWMNKRLGELGETWRLTPLVSVPVSSHLVVATTKNDPLDVRGEKLCHAMVEFAGTVKQEEPVGTYSPSASPDVMIAEALTMRNYSARVSREFEDRFAAQFTQIIREFEEKGISQQVHMAQPPPSAFEMRLGGEEVCRMVAEYRGKEGIPDPELAEKMRVSTSQRPCMGSPVPNDPFPNERAEQLGTMAIDIADVIDDKADSCVRTMQRGGVDNNSVRRSYAENIRQCCLDRVRNIHFAILNRCPTARNTDGERSFNIFLADEVPGVQSPACSVRDLAKYLRSMGQTMKDAY